MNMNVFNANDKFKFLEICGSSVEFDSFDVLVSNGDINIHFNSKVDFSHLKICDIHLSSDEKGFFIFH